VLTTVFAGTVGGTTRGGYGVPNTKVVEAIDAAANDSVSTGPCTA
jgi:hypothetical protein